MLIQSASSHPGLVRGTVVLLENSITLRITEQHKRMEVVFQQLFAPNCIEGGWSKVVPFSEKYALRSWGLAPIRTILSSEMLYGIKLNGEHWEQRTRYNPSDNVERHNYRDGGIILWAEICLDSHTDLHGFHEKILTGVKYRGKIDLFTTVGNEFILMNDNARNQ
ncbi:hypothetical protein TNCV_388071 [Trichonephila clavipes]|nr:hypothetical protein TNCV_388071 [Trichonephila clavipes]